MEEYDVDKTVARIFDTNDKTWKPSEKIPLLTKEIELLKADLRIFLNNSNYDIASLLLETKEMCKASTLLIFDIEMCQKEIKEQTMAEIQKSIENHNKVTKELKGVEFAMKILYDVVHSGKSVKEFENARQAESYTRAVEAMSDLKDYIELGVEGFKDLDFYASLKHKYGIITGEINKCLSEKWDNLVSWNIKQNTDKTDITITLKVHDTTSVVDVLRALNKCKKLTDKVSEFTKFLFKYVVVPIIHSDCLVYAETDELMSITINHNENCKPPYDAVIGNLRILFHYVNCRFNIEFERNITLMKLLSKEMCGKFRDVIIKDCFIETIPNNINDLQTYGRITSEIEDFQRFLMGIKFFPDKSYSVLDYIKNIDVLFANKSSQHFLETARKIMLKDLSESMSIGVESIPEQPVKNVNKKKDDGHSKEALNILDKTIPRSLFYFPRCMISKSSQELLDLVYAMMEQAVQCSDVVCKKLYITTRLVFELYDAVVPYHHENFLQTIPQYVALFHNNCMYLAHNLQTLGDKWLTLMEGREMDYPISFVDLVQSLRDLGYKHLTIHMQQQRKQILDNIRSSDLNCIVVKDVLGENVEAAIRQCLRQLQLLKNVWIGVFPGNVFTRLMATLVNMFFDELIHRVCTVEDISMEMATQLTELYTLVVQKTPQLFQNPGDLETHVKSWTKLKELIFVLGGTLKDIEHHWKDGTGPLAVHFKVEELRNLIKALFQNTQIRANLLSKIK